jgi:sugar lactone lactonase YvrE
MDWGTAPKDPKNPGPNEFNTVHSIQISKDGRLFVVDRGHRRIQVFDQNGKFLDMWTTGVRSQPYAHIITTDQKLWISDGGTNRIVEYDLDGHYLYGWEAQADSPDSSTVRTRSLSTRMETCIWPKSSTVACRNSGRSLARIARS